LCRIFKKTIQIPTKNNDEQVEETKKEMMLEEQLQGEDSSGTENSSEIMETMNIKVLNQDENPKFPCDASSSDVTQGTCTPTNTCNNIADDFHAQFACDEANSSAISYPIGIGYSSNLFQVTFLKNLIHIH
jgi:hypothetical protein